MRNQCELSLSLAAAVGKTASRSFGFRDVRNSPIPITSCLPVTRQNLCMPVMTRTTARIDLGSK